MEHIEEGIEKIDKNTITLKEGYNYCHICNKCNTNDYWYKNKFNKPVGPCKECINKKINQDIIKAIPYLDLFNLPYFPNTWKRCDSFGKYLSFCKLTAIKEMSFTDVYLEDLNEITKTEFKIFQDALLNYINNKYIKIEETGYFYYY